VQAAGPVACAVTDIARSTNVDIVLAFCKAGQMRDLETQMSFIADDSIYHNILRNIAETRSGAVPHKI
jgi:hypothetical protein